MRNPNQSKDYFRLPTEGEFCKPSSFLEEIIGDTLLCPKCQTSSDSDNWFFLKITGLTSVIPIHRFMNEGGGMWIYEKQHWEDAESYVIRCPKCHFCGGVGEFREEDFIVSSKEYRLSVNVLKIGAEWTMVSCRSKSFYILTDNVSRNVQERSQGILTGASYEDIVQNGQISSPEVFLIPQK